MSKTTFKPGHKKVGGRKKGTQNRKTLELMETLKELDFDPARALVHCYRQAEEIFEHRKQNGNLVGAIIALDSMSNNAESLAQYVFPKKKAIEHSGEVGVRTFADFMTAGKKQKDDAAK